MAGATRRPSNRLSTHGLEHLPRHQLYDAPMRSLNTFDEESGMKSPKLTLGDTLPLPSTPPRGEVSSMIANAGTPRHQTIKFGEDVAHYYPSPGKRGEAVHEHRSRNLDTLYPTSPPPGARVPSILSNASGDQSSTISGSGESSYNPYADITPKTVPRTAPPFSTEYEDPFGGKSEPAPIPRTAAIMGHSDSVDSFNSRDSLASIDTYVPAHSHKKYPRTSGDGDDSGGEESRRLVDTPPSPPDSQPSQVLVAGGIRLLPSTPKPATKF
ncbi:hypothetical protein FRC02_011951 [Tulasnella sp. 418]|nr:hypothetical protein FRC02_011951 [Tulasnella sp. 418]